MDYAGVFIEGHGGKLLFQMRDHTPGIPYPNQWSLFGGGIKHNETPRHAAARELQEELHINIHPTVLLPLVTIPTFVNTNYIFYLRLTMPLSGLRLCEGYSMESFDAWQLLFKNHVALPLRLLLAIYPLLRALQKVSYQQSQLCFDRNMQRLKHHPGLFTSALCVRHCGEEGCAESGLS